MTDHKALLQQAMGDFAFRLSANCKQSGISHWRIIFAALTSTRPLDFGSLSTADDPLRGSRVAWLAVEFQNKAVIVRQAYSAAAGLAKCPSRVAGLLIYGGAESLVVSGAAKESAHWLCWQGPAWLERYMLLIQSYTQTRLLPCIVLVKAMGALVRRAVWSQSVPSGQELAVGKSRGMRTVFADSGTTTSTLLAGSIKHANGNMPKVLCQPELVLQKAVLEHEITSAGAGVNPVM